MPSGLTMEQQMIYMKQLEIEEVSRRLRSNDLGIPGTRLDLAEEILKPPTSQPRRALTVTRARLLERWQAVEYARCAHATKTGGHAPQSNPGDEGD